jgi:hypothetical protein
MSVPNGVGLDLKKKKGKPTFFPFEGEFELQQNRIALSSSLDGTNLDL